jgi:S-adenosylmethionine:tRNA ribosyltransferase-isomerase
MKLKDFIFELPGELIAQSPPEKRGESRLMVLHRDRGGVEDRMVGELPSLLEPGSLLVFNKSRVRKARLRGRAVSNGAGVEFLLIGKTGDRYTWRTLVRRAKRRSPGSRYVFDGGVEAEITGTAEDGICRLRFDPPIDDPWLDIHGHIPLPPYIRREDEAADSERYQTVYSMPASSLGPGASSAAPTAGLHFSRELLEDLDRAGMERVFITLHVGLGTFLPVRTENIEDHVMHQEVYSIDEDAARRIGQAKKEGRRIVAVGTTSVRTLESAWEGEGPRAGEGITSIFIYPGYRFKAVDELFTNFHTPGSSLLMLAAAFAGGREFILDSYARAIREGYRFFSYGDAMLIR